MAFNKDRLVLISHGGGRDSETMRALLDEGTLVIESRECGWGDIDGIVASDTGNEWAFTYEVWEDCRRACEANGVGFWLLAKPAAGGPLGWQALHARGLSPHKAPEWVTALKDASIEEKAAGGYYHRRAPLPDDYRRTGCITLVKSAGCTDNHKIKPINGRFVPDLCVRRFGVTHLQWKRDVAAGLREPHLICIGYAADETSRLKGQEAKAMASYPYLKAVYPLIEGGITKAGERPILARHGLDGTRKSGCRSCHYQGAGWWWALRETDPLFFNWVCAWEEEAASKVGKDGKARPASYRFSSKRPLAEAVERWRARRPEATVDGVLDKDYGRGKPCETPQAAAPLVQVREPPLPRASAQAAQLRARWTSVVAS